MLRFNGIVIPPTTCFPINYFELVALPLCISIQFRAGGNPGYRHRLHTPGLGGPNRLRPVRELREWPYQ